eukprot:11514622-Karenia_brevis.AAC.1
MRPVSDQRDREVAVGSELPSSRWIEDTESRREDGECGDKGWSPCQDELSSMPGHESPWECKQNDKDRPQ